MQLRVIPAAFLFLGSYLPLALILLVQDIEKENWGRPICLLNGSTNCDFSILENPTFAIASVAITLASLIASLVSINSVRLKHKIHIQEAKSIPNDLISYAFPYVVSFMGISYNEPQKVAGFAVFLITLFVITLRAGQIFMNPILIILGWKIYEIKMAIGQDGSIRISKALSRERIYPGIHRAEEVQEIFLVGKNDK